MKGVIRLTPIVPGQEQPVIFVDGKIREGFVSGGPAAGRGFPQWAKVAFGGDKVHWFRAEAFRTGERLSLCGRASGVDAHLFLAGNYPRCKACEKALAAQARHGVRS